MQRWCLARTRATGRAIALAVAATAPFAQVVQALPIEGPPDSALAAESVPFDWQLPVGFPEPPVPDANPMSAVKVELGRRLFYDTRLSGDEHFSCASCHRQELAFTDGRDRAIGSTGEIHPRASMTLTNAAYNAAYNWADPKMTRLEEQALNPMFNEDPVELGLAGLEDEVVQRFEADRELDSMFARAFPGRGISIDTIAQAIASFERTLISGNSAYDRFVFFGEPLPDSAQRGMKLFFSDRTRCSECHAGLNLSGPVRVVDPGHEAEPEAVRPEFHNTGLFDLDGLGAYPEPNRGVFESTGRAEDMGAFRAPTLRNIEVTAPYMHDGSLASLAEVVDFYAAGGRGAGRSSPLKSPLLRGFELTEEERDDLVAFLKALTDRAFLTDPRFADPSSTIRTAS